MKRYLIRAGFDPYKTIDPMFYTQNSFVGGNSGNLMFPYGVMNVLKTNDTEFDETYNVKWTDKEAEEINEKYDAVIFPMADGFRKDFVEILNGMTDLTNRIKIPVIVIGVGLRSTYEPVFDNPFDEDVKRFVKAVLNRSAMLGLRGEITGEYLKRLGFSEGVDYTPIGCPSLYMYGNSIASTPPFSVHSLAFNQNTLAPYNVNKFILNSVDAIPNHVLIQQKQSEFMDMFLGRYVRNYKALDSIFDNNKLKKLNKEDKVRFFFDVHSWVEYLEKFDLFLGSRFHGTVAAILAGIPYVFLPFDSRTRELAEYHNITRLTPYEISPEKNIFDYIDKLDFNSFEKKQKDNLNHYVDFLQKNNLESVFDCKIPISKGNSVLEKGIDFSNCEIRCIDSLSAMGKAKRLGKYYFQIEKNLCKRCLRKVKRTIMR